MCPYLVDVIADRLWLFPVGVYCSRPDHRVRVPGAVTQGQVCTTPLYVECPGYRASAAAHGRPEPRLATPAAW